MKRRTAQPTHRDTRPVIVLSLLYGLMAPALSQSATSDFPKVHKRMLSQVRALGSFSAVIESELHTASDKQVVSQEIAYASDRLYRVRTQRTPARVGPSEDLMTRKGERLVVRQTQRDKRAVYQRYDLARMKPRDIPKCSPEELFGVPPLDPNVLKLFAAQGQMVLDGEPVVLYVCPPHERKKTRRVVEIPGLQSGSATKTGRVSVWIGAKDFLPRRIEMMTADGRPAIVKKYTKIRLSPRFAKDTFDCHIPKNAYWIDASAPPKDM